MSRPKRTSRGYTPASREELEAPIVGRALQLLLRIRADSDQRESDGFLTVRQLEAIGVEHGISRQVTRATVAELLNAELLRAERDGYLDVGFGQWCKTHDQRERERDHWNAAKKKPSHLDSIKDSTSESTVDSTRTAAAAVSAAVTTSAAAAMPPGLALNGSTATTAALEPKMPTQLDMILLADSWKSVSGRDATSGEIGHIAWWLDQFGDRLSATDIASGIKLIAKRQSDANSPVHNLAYFDGALRDLHAAAKPHRDNGGAIAEGEIPEIAGPPVDPLKLRRLVEEFAASKSIRGAA